MNQQLNHYLVNWQLNSPRPLAATSSSYVFKVSYQNQNAVLKILTPKGVIDEKNGATALIYFNGHGAVEVYEADAGAQLLEFVPGENLAEFAKSDHVEATQIICSVLKQIHSPRQLPSPNNYVTLEKRFRSLKLKSLETDCPVEFIEAAEVANELLHSQYEHVVLHGDIHHENILKSDKRGWLAIDPKGVWGERTYDVANSFYNPKVSSEILCNPDRIMSMAKIFSEQLGLDRQRILKFAFAHGYLRAAWMMEDELDAEASIKVAQTIKKALKVDLH
jgi:streptomycin 6-kinase